jgi:charged multivesicular body protein 4
MNLFGKKKSAAPAPTANPVDTIRNLRENLETLDKRENHISKKIDAALGEARQRAAKKDKKGALFALKRKKLYENEINKLQGAKITLETQIMSLESAAVNIETFKAMKSGTDTMKHMRGNIDADVVEDMMDDMEEEKEIQDSISDAISRPTAGLFDDEDLMNELAELEALDLDAELATPDVSLPSVPSSMPAPAVSLPEAPTSPLAGASKAAGAETEEERALRELEASMLA